MLDELPSIFFKPGPEYSYLPSEETQDRQELDDNNSTIVALTIPADQSSYFSESMKDNKQKRNFKSIQEELVEVSDRLTSSLTKVITWFI